MPFSARVTRTSAAVVFFPSWIYVLSLHSPIRPYQKTVRVFYSEFYSLVVCLLLFVTERLKSSMIIDVMNAENEN